MEFITRVRVIYFEIMFRELNVTKDAGHAWNLFSSVRDETRSKAIEIVEEQQSLHKSTDPHVLWLLEVSLRLLSFPKALV